LNIKYVLRITNRLFDYKYGVLVETALYMRIYLLDTKRIFKKKDLDFIGEYPFVRFGNLILIVGYIII
jgi:hypothetical protein